jgi:hypothetical protein
MHSGFSLSSRKKKKKIRCSAQDLILSQPVLSNSSALFSQQDQALLKCEGFSSEDEIVKIRSFL